MSNTMRVLRNAGLGMVVGMGLGLATFQMAGAASDQPPPPATGSPAESTLPGIGLPSSTVMYITALIIPLLGGFLIRYIKSDKGKLAVTIVLNGANALITTATTEGGDAVISAPLINNFVISTVISLGMLYGVYKRVEVNGATIDSRVKGAPEPKAA